MSDARQILQAYSLQVAPRLPPGNDAHDLGQALLEEVKSEPPDMLTLLRKYFQGSDSDESKTGYDSS